MMNRCVLVGRLTKDPDLRYTPNGVPVCTFTLAVNRTFTNSQGERETDFINCQVWRKAAENTANYLHKGSLTGVDGRIQTRNYEGQDGNRVYVTEVLAESVQFLEPKIQNESRNNQPNTKSRGNNQNRSQGENRRYTPDPGDPFATGEPIDISSDDLPF